MDIQSELLARVSVPHPGLKQGPIYLDYNATTPVDPRVLEAIWPMLSLQFGNPSSTHTYGQAAHDALLQARNQVTVLLNCAPDELVFTGCGSESDTLALRGVVLACRAQGRQRIHIITQVTEHPAILKTCSALERLYDVRVTYLPVDGYGQIRLHDLETAITPETVLVSIMHANNETGTLQPITKIAEIAHRHGILVHTDASQSVGKVPTNVEALSVDLLTLAGHKLYAPKGIGALYVRRGLPLKPAIYGGGQEHGRRAGTENVPYIVGLGKAAELAQEELTTSQQRLGLLRDRLHDLLLEGLPGRVYLNGHPTERLPNTLNVSIAGVSGEQVLTALPEIASSTGSACHEGKTEPSSVLLAMGIKPELALGALRLTLGRWSTLAEVEGAAALIIRTVCTQLS